MNYLIYIGTALILAFGTYAYMQSMHELQKRAAWRFLLASIVFSGLTALLVYFLPAAGFILLAFAALFFLLPASRSHLSFAYEREPKSRIDERDIMFSRSELKAGSERYTDYYNRHPERKEKDEQFRANPGLMSPNSHYYDALLFNATDSAFKLVEDLQKHVNGPIASDQVERKPEEWSHFLITWAKKLGAISAGICELKDTHYYSVGGRKERYGEIYNKEHSFALAFTVEMDHEMMMYAPNAPTLLESAHQYLQSGSIAVQLADLIRSMGYEARAHIDGNYKVVAPVVARDAGLGEIGRMGLLMTPELGPRVRIGIVTCNLPLQTSPVVEDNSVIDFCALCKKCAINCPGQAISMFEPQEVDGVVRWQIKQEDCFKYWTIGGTDCGRCVIVCPYSHPNNFLHNMVREGIRKSGLFRKFALRADDYFYGKKPKPLKMPPDSGTFLRRGSNKLH